MSQGKQKASHYFGCLIQFNTTTVYLLLQRRHTLVNVPVTNGQVNDESVYSIRHELTLLLPLTTPNFVSIALRNSRSVSHRKEIQTIGQDINSLPQLHPHHRSIANLDWRLFTTPLVV